ncbi:MAG: hypothetical protein U9N10_06965 [Bacillota bacterium]|nr:hypothetical protein [Bacillota bacterium]
MSGIVALFGFVIILIFLAATVGLYLLMAIGLKKLADNRGIENSWVAFIPILQLYVLGLLIVDLEVFGFEIPEVSLVLPGSTLITPLVSTIPLIGGIYSLAVFIVFAFALYKLFKMYVPESAQLYVILSVVLPFMGPILIFTIRDNELVEGE